MQITVYTRINQRNIDNFRWQKCKIKDVLHCSKQDVQRWQSRRDINLASSMFSLINGSGQNRCDLIGYVLDKVYPIYRFMLISCKSVSSALSYRFDTQKKETRKLPKGDMKI